MKYIVLFVMLFSGCINKHAKLVVDNDVTINRLIKIKEKAIQIFYKRAASEIKTKKIKIYRNGKNSFIYLKNKKIYLSTDTAAKFNGDLCSLISKDFIDPIVIPSHNPVVSVLFILNSKGNIISKGLLRPDLDNYFNEFTLRRLREISDTHSFTPARINGMAVNSIFKYSIQFSNLQCSELT